MSSIWFYSLFFNHIYVTLFMNRSKIDLPLLNIILFDFIWDIQTMESSSNLGRAKLDPTGLPQVQMQLINILNVSQWIMVNDFFNYICLSKLKSIK